MLLMYKNIKDFTIGVLASLSATFLTTYAVNIILFDKAINLTGLVNLILDYKFLFYWMLFLIFIIIIRWFIRKQIFNLQTPFPMVIGFGGHYELEFEGESYGFKWKVYANPKRRNNYTDEILDINVGKVEGPYCKNDYRKMQNTRTYFGRYKYKCPKCGYKRILLKDSWTLKCDIEDDLEAEYREKLKLNKQNIRY